MNSTSAHHDTASWAGPFHDTEQLCQCHAVNDADC